MKNNPPDAEETIALSPTWFKGYSHMSAALVRTCQWERALQVAEEGLKHVQREVKLLRTMTIELWRSPAVIFGKHGHLWSWWRTPCGRGCVVDDDVVVYLLSCTLY